MAMQESEHHGDRWFKEASEQADRRKRINSILGEITTATKRAGVPLGETGTYPEGVLTPDDEGELRFAVTVESGKVILAFGKPITWIGMTPRIARQLADTLNGWASRV